MKVQKHRIDFWILATVSILSFFGVLMVYEASSVPAFRDFGDKYYFLRDQTKWLILGGVVLSFTCFFDYHHFYKLALPFLILTLILLGGVFIPGFGIKALGAYRWLDFRFFILQPGELAKLALVIYLAAWFSSPEKGRLLAFLFLIGIVGGLVILEPDMGTMTILIGIALVMYFISGAALSHFLFFLPASLIAGWFLVKIEPYRFRRVLTFFRRETDPLGISYHIHQILIALGSGGFWGLGLGKSRQKYEYLPEAMTDSIFAIIGEELGFLGGGVLILLFSFLIWRGFKIARSAPDRFGQLLAVGIISWLAIQISINLSAQVVLIPLTGVPLPFISYGGSSLVLSFGAIGILLNISKQCVVTKR